MTTGGTESTPISSKQAPGAAVDAALAQLSRLGELSVDEHVAVFEAIHAALRDSLADAGTRPAGQPL